MKLTLIFAMLWGAVIYFPTQTTATFAVVHATVSGLLDTAQQHIQHKL